MSVSKKEICKALRTKVQTYTGGMFPDNLLTETPYLTFIRAILANQRIAPMPLGTNFYDTYTLPNVTRVNSSRNFAVTATGSRNNRGKVKCVLELPESSCIPVAASCEETISSIDCDGLDVGRSANTILQEYGDFSCIQGEGFKTSAEQFDECNGVVTMPEIADYELVREINSIDEGLNNYAKKHISNLNSSLINDSVNGFIYGGAEVGIPKSWQCNPDAKPIYKIMQLLIRNGFRNPVIIDTGIFDIDFDVAKDMQGATDKNGLLSKQFERLPLWYNASMDCINDEDMQNRLYVFEAGSIALAAFVESDLASIDEPLKIKEDFFSAPMGSPNLGLTYDLYYEYCCAKTSNGTPRLKDLKVLLRAYPLFVKMPNLCEDKRIQSMVFNLSCETPVDICDKDTVTCNSIKCESLDISGGELEFVIPQDIITVTEPTTGYTITEGGFEVIPSINGFTGNSVYDGDYADVIAGDVTVPIEAGTYQVKFTVTIEGDGLSCEKVIKKLVCVQPCSVTPAPVDDGGKKQTAKTTAKTVADTKKATK